MREEIVEGVPTIDFSDRVYGLIDNSMSKTLVVKLLGRRIGYNLYGTKCVLCRNLRCAFS